MAWSNRYRRSRTRRPAKKRRGVSLLRRRVSAAYAASPAGKHRRLAKICFGAAKKARAKGNKRKAASLVGYGRRALALCKAEYRLYKKGHAIFRRSAKVHRAFRA